MNLKRIRYFVAVAEDLHFGRAAERLNVVQPAISQQIKLLEDDLGAHLFDRSSRKVSLTEAGKAYLVEARRVVQQVELAAQAAQDAVQGLAGTLRVGFVDSAIWSPLPQVIRSFRKSYPRIDLMLSQMPRSLQLAMLDNSELDLAILPGPLLRPGFATLELGRSPLVVALPKGHPIAAQARVRVEALALEPFIALPSPDDPHRVNEVIYQLCARAGFVPILRQAVGQIHTSLSLVSAGLGVAIVPRWICAAWSDNIEYRQLEPPSDYVLLVCYRQARSSRMIQAMLDTIREHVPGVEAPAGPEG